MAKIRVSNIEGRAYLGNRLLPLFIHIHRDIHTNKPTRYYIYENGSEGCICKNTAKEVREYLERKYNVV